MQTSQCLSYRSLQEGGRVWRPSKPTEVGEKEEDGEEKKVDDDDEEEMEG